MVTKKQQKWLDHLKTDDRITIVPYGPKSSVIFEKVKARIMNVLGNGFEILHRGASYLKISGQNEIDVYVPVLPKDFDTTIKAMIKGFGEPKSNYPLVRARFPVPDSKKHIDIFVINKEDDGWVESETFTNFLMSHSNVLDQYRQLKEDCNGLSTKEYYTRKIEFINNVLDKAKK
jgi:GrpB-like predicted nucleotidyltransferase (UPF0157 family)